MMKIKTIEQSINEYGFVIHDVVGQSMLPLLKEGINKVKLVKPTELNLFDVVLYKGNSKNYVLHRIIDVSDNKLTILGDNNKFLEFKNKNDVVAKMEGYFEGTDFISVNSNEYLNYLKNVYPFTNEENRKIVLENPKQFFLDRQRNAYFELMKLEIKGTLDKTPINSLTPSEKILFSEQMVHKKGISYLSLAIKSFGVDLGEKLNKEVIKRANDLLNVIVREDIAIEQISNALNNNEIPHIFLKGSETKKMYRYQELRMRNDIDLYVDSKNYKKACEVVENELNGNFMCDTNHDISYILPLTNVHLELHHTINDELPNDLKYLLEDPFEDAVKIDNSYRYTLNNDKMMLYTLAHSAKHARVGQTWISLFLDVYHLLQTKFDYELIKKARLDKYLETLIHYLENITDNKQLTQSEIYFANMWYLDSLDNEGTVARSKYQNSFKYYLYRIFMPFDELTYFYPNLKKHPILYPYYWCKRLFRIAFNKERREYAKTELTKFSESKKEEAEAFNDVGLSEYSTSNFDRW